MRRGIGVALAIVVLLSGCTQTPPAAKLEKKVTNSEILGNGVEIVSGAEGIYPFSDIRYPWDNRTYTGTFYFEIRRPLVWINESLPTDARILAWWDYGHTIRGFTGREVVLATPSESIMFSVADLRVDGKWDAEKKGAVAPDAVVQDVALALASTNATQSQSIAQKLGADYVLLTAQDPLKAWLFYNITGLPFNVYPTSSGNIALDVNSTFYRMLNLQNVTGFDFAYTDSKTTVIYKVSNRSY